jgi:hypothetical protein
MREDGASAEIAADGDESEEAEEDEPVAVHEASRGAGRR